jgi:hypothetical protein
MHAQHVASDRRDETPPRSQPGETPPPPPVESQSHAFERPRAEWLPTSSGWLIGQIVLPVILAMVAIAAIVIGALSHAL